MKLLDLQNIQQVSGGSDDLDIDISGLTEGSDVVFNAHMDGDVAHVTVDIFAPVDVSAVAEETATS
jgi:hypothetical protein